MRFENRLRMLEGIAGPVTSFVVVTDEKKAAQYRAQHPGLAAPIIVTGVPRGGPFDA